MARFVRSRWLWLSGAGLVALLVLGTIGVIALYPRLGAWAVRRQVLPRLEARLERSITVADIEVERGWAILHDVRVAGPRDAGDGAPLVRIGRIEADFDFWSTLTGGMQVHRVVLDGMHVEAVRAADGTDNFRDIADALRGKSGQATASSGAGNSGLRPELLLVRNASFRLRDAAAGITLEAATIEATVGEAARSEATAGEATRSEATAGEAARSEATAGEAARSEATAGRGSQVEVIMRDLAVRTAFGPSARADQVVITADTSDLVGTAEVEIAGGELSAHRMMSLSSIFGRVHKGEQPGTLVVDLGGSYGGATERLWTARGRVAPLAGEASMAIVAERFTFDRLDSILRDSMIIDYAQTAISAEMRIDVAAGRVRFDGAFELAGGNVFHPMIAEKPLRDLQAAGRATGYFDMATRILEVSQAELTSRGVAYRVEGFLRAPGGREPQTGQRREHAHVKARLVIPPVPCQTMLQAIPEALAPYLAGFQLKGTFQTDLEVEIDWADLQATHLGGSVGIFGCKVIKEPDDESGIQRLNESFMHYVEVEVDSWSNFVIGPENPDFVPLWDVSPHVSNSFMTTEDSAFYKHHGFITREFRTALIKNLEAGYFRYGASSITMQTVKNVLLYREKTLARKLQELFLTWYIETVLDKERILEIYINAIEYGPGLYGIGPAARHYFGKHPRDLNPVEAAFFSSILPSPKLRYRQYCEDKLTRWTETKIQRILKLMHSRERLTLAEYELALATPLVFDRTEAPPLKECKKMVKRAVQNARPTNPMKK